MTGTFQSLKGLQPKWNVVSATAADAGDSVSIPKRVTAKVELGNTKTKEKSNVVSIPKRVTAKVERVGLNPLREVRSVSIPKRVTAKVEQSR